MPINVHLALRLCEMLFVWFASKRKAPAQLYKRLIRAYVGGIYWSGAMHNLVMLLCTVVGCSKVGMVRTLISPAWQRNSKVTWNIIGGHKRLKT
jgi:hypothetical protein